MRRLCLRSVTRGQGSVRVLERRVQALSLGVSRGRRPLAGSVLPERVPCLQWSRSRTASERNNVSKVKRTLIFVTKKHLCRLAIVQR
jgi:hypothetical protein